MTKKPALDNLRVVLVETRNPLNVGAVARAMSNFGAMDLRLVNPFEKAYREAVSAVGAAEVMKRAQEFAALQEAIADCRLVVGTTAVGHREVKHPLRSLEAAGPVLRRELAKGRVALLFGSEKRGLSNESLSHCHWLLRIPTREEHDSMNLGQAAAVCLYELARPAKPTPLKGTERLAAELATVDRIGEALLEALQASGYIPPRGRTSAEEKLRRMLRRMDLQSADAEVLLGMLRKILWKLHNA